MLDRSDGFSPSLPERASRVAGHWACPPLGVRTTVPTGTGEGLALLIRELVEERNVGDADKVQAPMLPGLLRHTLDV